MQAPPAIDNTKADTKPDPAGGDGWKKAGGQVIFLAPDEIIALAGLNNFDEKKTKTWTIKLRPTPQTPLKELAKVVGRDPHGWNDAGGESESHAQGSTVDEKNGVYILGYQFTPQPAWERVTLENKSKQVVAFTIEMETSCLAAAIKANAVQAQCQFGAAGPGVMLSNQLISEVWIFAKTVAVDPNAPASFQAPGNTGMWWSELVTIDPDGNTNPLGGIRFMTDGPGLDPSQEAAFSFAMEGPAADLQYTMYAYDAAAGEFQSFNIDLRPSLSIAKNQNGMILEFPSISGINYTLEKSGGLNSWQPLQSFTGDGNLITTLPPRMEGASFFRLSCEVARNSITDTVPPQLLLVTPDASGDSIHLTFSEPIDELSVNNLLNYYLADTSFQPLSVLGGYLSTPQSVDLIIDPALSAGTSYYLGVEGVRDLAGNVMVPGTLSFTIPAVTVDKTPPKVTSLIPSPSHDRITVTFSEPVNMSTALALSHYWLSTGAGTVPINRIVSRSPQAVDLLINPPPMVPGLNHLAVYDVKDIAGNPMLTISIGWDWGGWWYDPCAELLDRINDAKAESDTADSAFSASPSHATAAAALTAAENLNDLCNQFIRKWPNGGGAAGPQFGPTVKQLARDRITKYLESGKL